MKDTIDSMCNEFIGQNVLALEEYDGATIDLMRDSFFCGAGAAIAIVAAANEADRLASMQELGKEFLRFSLTLDLNDDDREMIEHSWRMVQ